MTTTKQLTSRERVNRAFSRQEHDRVPRHESFWGQTIKRWQGEGLEGDAEAVLDLLGGDFKGIGWCWPSVYANEVVLERDEQTLVKRDTHGRTARWWRHRDGTPEHIGFECDSPEKWQTTYKPMLLARPPLANLDQVREAHTEGRRRGKWVYLAGVEAFEITRAMIGDETTLMAMVEEPQWIADVSRTFTDRIIAEYQRCIDAGMSFDGLFTYGDMAYNHATMCSPGMYRELIWPDHKRLADFAHANGMKFIYHTDGNVNGVIDLYLEAGFDCLQPLEAKAGMDVRNLVPRYGDRMAFFGNVDVMVMATNNHALIEAEVRAKIEAGKASRGYIYHSDHSVPPSVSWDTYRFIIECIDRYGQYP